MARQTIAELRSELLRTTKELQDFKDLVTEKTLNHPDACSEQARDFLRSLGLKDPIPDYLEVTLRFQVDKDYADSPLDVATEIADDLNIRTTAVVHGSTHIVDMIRCIDDGLRRYTAPSGWDEV